MTVPAFGLRDVAVDLGGRRVLEVQSLDITPACVTVVLGPNGAGKTTLLRSLGLLVPLASGSLELFGTARPLGAAGAVAWRRRLGWVEQRPYLFRGTVAANVAYPLRLRGLSPGEIEARVAGALAMVDMLELCGRRAAELSGGEAQRVALARALATAPEVLLLDEPTANLDPASAGRVEEAVRRYARHNGGTVVLVTHGLFLARRLADKAIFLEGGTVVESGEAGRVLHDPQTGPARAFVAGETAN